MNHIDHFQLTKHASERLTQRGIDVPSLKIVFDHALIFHAGKNDVAFWLGKKNAAKIANSVNSISKAVNIAVVVTSEGLIKTIMRCNKPPRHWKRAA